MTEEKFSESVIRINIETGSSPIAVGRPLDKMSHQDSGEKRHSTAGPNGLIEERTTDSPYRQKVGSRGVDTSVDETKWRDYRRLCDDLVAELRHADRFLVDGVMSDEGLEIIAEVEGILDKLYDSNWGAKEYLKRVVVAIQSQVSNVRWTSDHVNFLKDISRILRVAYTVDDKIIERCYELMHQHNLDPFRGTVTAHDTLKRYQIREVDQIGPWGGMDRE